MSEIVNDWPPNIEKIRAVLPVSEGNIFAYGGKIYVPGGGDLPVWLVAHEEEHFRQHEWYGLRSWWKRFLNDVEFRLDQELEAHRVEWWAFCRENKDRNVRSRYLALMARRMSAPMYGGMITMAEAKREIVR